MPYLPPVNLAHPGPTSTWIIRKIEFMWINGINFRGESGLLSKLTFDLFGNKGIWFMGG